MKGALSGVKQKAKQRQGMSPGTFFFFFLTALDLDL